MKRLLFLAFALAGLPLAADVPSSIRLQPPALGEGKLLMRALQERSSARGFTDREIPLQNLSDLFWAASGINRPESGKRTAPSASNRQELEVYGVFKDGIYRYDAKAHALELVAAGDYRALSGNGEAGKAALDLLYISDTTKTGPGPKPGAANTVSYVNVGFMAQNVYLYCASAGLGTRVRGGWNSAELAAVMQLPPTMVIVLGQTVGYVAAPRDGIE